MRPKKFFLPVAAAAIGGLLLGCGDAGSSTGNDGPVDLTMTIYSGDPDVIATYEAIGADFREINPRLGTFTVDTIASDTYVPALMTRIRGGDSPDIGWMQEVYVPGLAASNTIADISSLLQSSDTYNIDDMLPNAMEAAQHDGGLYGHPFANTAYGIFYNKDMFDEAGIVSPLELFEKGQWTWEELRRLSREIVDTGAAEFGFDIPAFQYARLSFLTPVLAGFGAEPWPGGDSCGLDSSAANDAFEFWRSMIWDDDSFPAPGEKSSFEAGNVAMVMAAPSLLNSLDKDNFAVEMVPQPSGAPGATPYFGQSFLVAFADGKDTELAAELIAFIGNEENSKRLASYYIPARESLLDGATLAAANPLLTAEGADRVLVKPLFDASQMDIPFVYPELEALVRPVLDGVWLQEADVAGVLADVCAKADQVLG